MLQIDFVLHLDENNKIIVPPSTNVPMKNVTKYVFSKDSEIEFTLLVLQRILCLFFFIFMTD